MVVKQQARNNPRHKIKNAKQQKLTPQRKTRNFPEYPKTQRKPKKHEKTKNEEDSGAPNGEQTLNEFLKNQNSQETTIYKKTLRPSEVCCRIQKHLETTFELLLLPLKVEHLFAVLKTFKKREA